MATFITGVITDAGRAALAKSFGQVGGFPNSFGSYFKYGEGGYIQEVGGRVPKDPDPSLTNIEATGAPGDFFFQKSFIASDLVFIAPSSIQLRCLLETTEANDNGLAESPRFFEIGVFDDNDNMIAYATFDEQTKNASKQLKTFVQIYF